MIDATSEAAEPAQGAQDAVDLSNMDEETLLALAQGGEQAPEDADADLTGDEPAAGLAEEGDPGMVSYAAARVGEDVDHEKLAEALEQTYDHMGRVQAHAFVDETLKVLDGHVKTGSITEEVRSLFVDGLRLLYSGHGGDE